MFCNCENFGMNIALVNIPSKDNMGNWRPLPPGGYGGIQWYVFILLNGYLELGCKVWLLGAPFTKMKHKNLFVQNVADSEDIYNWLKKSVIRYNINIIHDHSNMIFSINECNFDCVVVATSHFTGIPSKADYNTFVSFAQRTQAQNNSSPVIRVPVHPHYYHFSSLKEDYLLYLGRISPWKGVHEAADFAAKANIKLLIAGPTLNDGYLESILSNYKSQVEYIGEVGGNSRQKLISKAKALLVFSMTTQGPWGDVWCEPGSTVVSEAASSGTPVISSDNGCLKEITPYVGTVIPECVLTRLKKSDCEIIINNLPSSEEVYSNAIKEWHYLKISASYLRYFKKILCW